MKPQVLAMAADQGQRFAKHRHPTHWDVFLSTTEQVAPRPALRDLIGAALSKARQGPTSGWLGTDAADVLRAGS